MFHCSKIDFQTSWAQNEYTKSWLLFAGKEQKDNAEIFEKAVYEIMKTLRYSNSNKVVICPFKWFVGGHSSVDLVYDLKSRLSKYNITVYTESIENASKMFFDVFGHRVSVAYREI